MGKNRLISLIFTSELGEIRMLVQILSTILQGKSMNLFLG